MTVRPPADRLQRVRPCAQQESLIAANRRLLGRLVTSQEAERSALARELHDGPVQTLIAALRLLELDAGAGPGRSGPRAQLLLRDALDDLRRISRGIRPAVLDTLGIERALSQYIDSFNRSADVPVAFEHAGPDAAPRLSDAIELTLLRVTQEALSNVMRHSCATRASVVLVRSGDEVSLIVEDNGCGFRVDEPDGEALGLRNIHERAALVGGRCDILSAPGNGTVVRIRIPVQRAVEVAAGE